MLTKTWNELIEQTKSLAIDEQIRLALYLLQRAITTYPSRRSPLAADRTYRQWREIRGLARPRLLGEDAQAWVSRTRREADTRRAHTLRDQT